VTVDVKADYSSAIASLPANVQQLVPNKVIMEWVADDGTCTKESDRVEILNSPTATSPCSQQVTCP
jgi:hypothetical protein